MAGVKDAVVVVVVLVEVASGSNVVVEVRVDERENWDTHSTLSMEYKPESMLGSSLAISCLFFLFFRQLLGAVGIVF